MKKTRHIKNFVILFFLFFFSSTEAQKTINASEIIEDLKNGKNISYQNKTIIGTLDFTFMNEKLPNLPNRKRWWNNYGNNTIKKTIDSKISFINCTFKDDVLAYIPDEISGYTFIANFENTILFKNCLFNEKAMFKYSEFEDNTTFEGSQFKNDSTFKYAKFEKECSFKNTIFVEEAIFKYTSFKKFISFENSIFKDTATFKYTNFKRGISFKNTSFKEDLNIKYAKITGKFDITNMKVAYEIDAKYTTINGQSFNKYLISQ